MTILNIFNYQPYKAIINSRTGKGPLPFDVKRVDPHLNQQPPTTYSPSQPVQHGQEWTGMDRKRQDTLRLPQHSEAEVTYQNSTHKAAACTAPTTNGILAARQARVNVDKVKCQGCSNTNQSKAYILP